MTSPPSNGKTLLITGINGFIASALGLHVLSKGYSLVGTARRAATTKALLEGPYAAFASRVKIVEVPNMTVDGAFDQAVKGVHGIFHTASPINFGLDSYDATVVTAEKGSLSLLYSALKAGPQLESVVVTSSVAAIFDSSKPIGYTFTELDLAFTNFDLAIKEREKQKSIHPGLLYSASKIAAERAVWRFRDEIKPPFAISTVNPTVVIGPPVVVAATASSLNETLKPVFEILSGASETLPPPIGSASYVDVRDVALIHLWAYENPQKANGERYLASGGYCPPQVIADILSTSGWEHTTKGVPGEGYIGYNAASGSVDRIEYPEAQYKLDGRKAEAEMGFTYISAKDSIRDTAEALKVLL
ncbi:nad dependent epimerase [Phlyctema vagabunda]|uniref:Nad dependent epimerase n=1 Tax=Phlyctema vagabunda TaxID=108571 RepID=A0ABR4PWD5_9HELO